MHESSSSVDQMALLHILGARANPAPCPIYIKLCHTTQHNTEHCKPIHTRCDPNRHTNTHDVPVVLVFGVF